jgi:hypothetical protein
MSKFAWGARSFGLIMAVLLGSCTDPDTNCDLGALDCACNAGQCLAGLACEANVCVQHTGEGEETNGETAGDSDEITATEGDGDGDTGCTPGELGCECNDGLCLEGLECNEGLCTEPTCPQGQEMCDGVCVNLMFNDANCGECGNACQVFSLDGGCQGSGGEYGGCVDGACTPTLTDCYTWDSDPLSCDEVCAELGSTCAPQGCGAGFTHVYYNVNASCVEHCPHHFDSDPCSEPSFASTGSYRCCCNQ